MQMVVCVLLLRAVFLQIHGDAGRGFLEIEI
jgi:hypothetical protein